VERRSSSKDSYKSGKTKKERQSPPYPIEGSSARQRRAERPRRPERPCRTSCGATRRVDAASLGRRVDGPLIIPAISSLMGRLLYRASTHSGVLRTFLGIRPPRVSRSPPAVGPPRGAGFRGDKLERAESFAAGQGGIQVGVVGGFWAFPSRGWIVILCGMSLFLLKETSG